MTQVCEPLCMPIAAPKIFLGQCGMWDWWFKLYLCSFKNESRAEFYFWSSVSNPTRSKQRYAWFLQRKKQIEAEVGPLNWEELKEKNACRISLSCPGGYMTEQKQWPEIHARLIEMMMKLHAALQPLIDSGEVERI